MSAVIEHFPFWITSLVLKSSVVFLVAWLGTQKLVGASSAARHAVWCTAIVAVLALPLVSLAPVEIGVPVSRLAELTPSPLRGNGWTPVAPSTGGAPRASIRGAATNGSRIPPTGVTSRSRGSLATASWKSWVVLLYALGAAAVIARTLVGGIRVRLVIRASTPVRTHDEWKRSVAAVPQARARRSILRVCDALETPATCGVLRPIVLLPNAGASWPEELRRNALVHELAHVERRDWLTQVLGVVACVVYWFNPLVWCAARRLHLEAERTCDERVVRFGSEPHSYAQQLVDLARGRRVRYLGAVAMSSRSELADRVSTILRARKQPAPGSRVRCVVAVAVTAAGVLTAPLAITGASQPVVHRQTAGNERNERTPLMNAAARGDAPEVQRLLAADAKVNEQLRGRGTALILAATYGHTEVVQPLIDAGADVNLSETSPRRAGLLRTPLAAAARSGSTEIATELLDQGAQIEAAPRGDATALMEAAEHGHLAVVQLLLERGAEVDREIDGDGTALIAAARGGDVRIARTLVDAGAKVNRGVPGDGNALIAAVRNGDRSMVQYLLAQGANPNAEVPGDESALVAAAEAGDTELLRMLLDAVESR